MVDFSFQEMVLLENDGLRDFGTDSDEIKYEYFMNRNLSDVLTGLTCHQLERVNLLDILMVLLRNIRVTIEVQFLLPAFGSYHLRRRNPLV